MNKEFFKKIQEKPCEIDELYNLYKEAKKHKK